MSFCAGYRAMQFSLRVNYTGSGTISAFKLQTGRPTGLSLQIANSASVVKTGSVLTGAEHTIGFAFKRTAGTQTFRILNLHFNSLPTALLDIRSFNNGDIDGRLPPG